MVAVHPSTSNPSTLTFTSQPLELFETRFSEGYDIYVLTSSQCLAIIKEKQMKKKCEEEEKEKRKIEREE